MKMTFENWCAKNYYKIRECLSLQGRFDEDAFHDAFLSTIRAIRKSGNALDIEGQIKKTIKRIIKVMSAKILPVSDPMNSFLLYYPIISPCHLRKLR